MLGAMFIGLSGMTAYSNGLREVSNNITNLNSNGYRASTVEFSDLFGKGGSGVSYSNQYSGSGSGVQLANARLDLSQGDIRTTENDLDLAVDGDGFLVLEKEGEYFYARTGSFEVNTEGYIVLSGTDYKLTVLNSAGQATALSIDSYRTDEPEKTSRITFADNLSSTATELTLSDLNIYDSQGEADIWEIAFTRAETETDWTVTVNNSAGDPVDVQTLKFVNGAIDPATAELTFTAQDDDRSVVLDFSENVTSFSSGAISTLRTSDIDGYAIGDITSIAVNDTGILEIGYSNAQDEALGAVTLASFDQVNSLEQIGSGLFTYGESTGRQFLSSGSDRVGLVRSNRIEASNVDLSAQFGDLILVQRGYQAASQVVSVSNDMIQQLFGLRGQG